MNSFGYRPWREAIALKSRIGVTDQPTPNKLAARYFIRPLIRLTERIALGSISAAFTTSTNIIIFYFPPAEAFKTPRKAICTRGTLPTRSPIKSRRGRHPRSQSDNLHRVLLSMALSWVGLTPRISRNLGADILSHHAGVLVLQDVTVIHEGAAALPAD
jgi:hypothetical protein